MEQTTPRSSSSLILYRFSLLFKNRDANKIGIQPLTVSCSDAAPTPEQEASQFVLIALILCLNSNKMYCVFVSSDIFSRFTMKGF